MRRPISGFADTVASALVAGFVVLIMSLLHGGEIPTTALLFWIVYVGMKGKF